MALHQRGTLTTWLRSIAGKAGAHRYGSSAYCSLPFSSGARAVGNIPYLARFEGIFNGHHLCSISYLWLSVFVLPHAAYEAAT